MDPRQVLEHEAEVALDEAKARVRAAVDEALASVLADIGASARKVLAAEGAARGTARKARAARPKAAPRVRITRTDASREFGITMSKLRTMERKGVITPRRKGGRIMLDRDEVAAALAAQQAATVDLTAHEPAPAE